jgi:Arc/MetJ-type ribon-helix-helix transcriptional regulator
MTMNKKLPSEWDRAHGKKTRIHLHMPDTLLQIIETWVQKGRYLDRSTMIRQACWDLVERLEQEPEKMKEPEEEEEPLPPGKPEPTIRDLVEVYDLLNQEVPS